MVLKTVGLSIVRATEGLRNGCRVRGATCLVLCRVLGAECCAGCCIDLTQRPADAAAAVVGTMFRIAAMRQPSEVRVATIVVHIGRIFEPVPIS